MNPLIAAISKWKYLLLLKLSLELSATPLHWVGSRLLCQRDNSDLLINVSNRTRSTWLQSRELSTPLTTGRDLVCLCQPDNSDLLIHANTLGTISISMFQRNQITLYFNQSGVMILADLIYEIFMLHVKFQYVFTILWITIRS